MAPALYSVPVKSGNAVYIQPDGSHITVKIRGDEWTRLRTTEDGCSIAKNEDGWWCYSTYNEDGTIKCTEYKVGQPAPADVLAASRRIPYDVLSRKAESKRAKMGKKNSSSLSSIKRANSIITRSSTIKERKVIVIPVQFTDVKFTYTADDFRNLLNKKDYIGTGSVKDYYESQFGENWTFTFDVTDIVTMPNSLKYYGENDADKNDKNPMEMALQACKLVDDKVDFSKYDFDKDQIVDNVCIFYAGYDEAENTGSPELIWAHQYTMFPYDYYLPQEALTNDGVYLDSYTCSSELTGDKRYGTKKMTAIGTFCHEYAHTLGLPDFYDTDYDEGTAWGAGLWSKTSLMDGGNYNNDSRTPPNFNCIERELLGLSAPAKISANKSYTLSPIHENGQYLQMESKTDGEYYLFECRSNEGWDAHIGGSGMLVYHIDKNQMDYDKDYQEYISWWDLNILNADPNHQCADLIEADGRSDRIIQSIFNKDIRGIFFPQSNVTSIIPDKTPGYKFWTSGTPSISIIGIEYKEGTIRFNTNNGSDNIPVADVHNVITKEYPDAIFISFDSSDPEAGGSAILEWKKKDESKYNTVELNESDNGSYSYLIAGLESGNILYDIRIRFKNAGALGDVYESHLLTKKKPAVDWPYLSLSDGAEVNLHKGLVAHVVNAKKASEIKWFLDGEELVMHTDYRIYPQKSGSLSCLITWENGSSDMIVKEIILTED